MTYEIQEGKTNLQILNGEFHKDSEGNVELILIVQVFDSQAYLTHDEPWKKLEIKIKDWSYIEA